MAIIVVLLRPPVAPIAKVQMKPCFMMATLISRSQAECFSWDGECTVHAHLLSKIDRNPVGGLRNPQTSAQLSGMDPGSHNGVGPGGVGKAQSVKASSIVLRLSLAATSPRRTIEITCNQVNFLRNHNGTKSENELLGDAFLLGVDVADM